MLDWDTLGGLHVDVALLQRATAQDHASVEGTVSLMDPELDLSEYVAVICRMHGVVAAWEECAEAAAPEWLKPHLQDRSRLKLLEQDIVNLKGGIGGDRAPLPAFRGEAELMGAMYVMEGSRLGGQLIARHVENRLGLGSGHGVAYLLGHGRSTGAKWKEFLGVLESRVPESATPEVIYGAKLMFRAFEDWMRGMRPDTLLCVVTAQTE